MTLNLTKKDHDLEGPRSFIFGRDNSIWTFKSYVQNNSLQNHGRKIVKLSMEEKTSYWKESRYIQSDIFCVHSDKSSNELSYFFSQDAYSLFMASTRICCKLAISEYDEQFSTDVANDTQVNIISASLHLWPIKKILFTCCKLESAKLYPVLLIKL